MAQTRAGAKALRNVLAWVAVLAGYKPTPAEEIVDVIPEKPKGLRLVLNLRQRNKSKRFIQLLVLKN